MLRVRDIMTTDVLTMSPQTSVREAMELLAKNRVSGMPVVSGGRLVGVVTGTDLMSFASGLSGVTRDREAPEPWEEDFDEPTDDETIDAALEPGGAFFSELWDDLQDDVVERIDRPEGVEWNVLEEHDVSEVMTRVPLATIEPDARTDDAAELMKTKRIHRVLVTHEGQLVGIVSSLDITTAVADDRL